MTQRAVATIAAGVLLVALLVSAAFLPLPFVTYNPGPTVDVLGTHDGHEVIEVEGHRAYRDGGQLRMTTVSLTPAGSEITLFDAMHAWISDDRAVYPYSAVYDEKDTAESSRQESAVQMVSSQDVAIAAAFKQLGYRTSPAVEVLSVDADRPADGVLEPGDVITKVGDQPVGADTQVVIDAVSASADTPIEVTVRRAGDLTRLPVTPDADGKIGIGLGPGFDFPFDVSVSTPDDIGGPSAGLIFSLAIWDTLTPGSLTDDKTIAGTGTITEDGVVGSIGGIQQKIAASREAGAGLFLVPADNCPDVVGAPNGDMELVRVATFDEALTAIKTWTDDPDAALPQCSEDAA